MTDQSHSGQPADGETFEAVIESLEDCYRAIYRVAPSGGTQAHDQGSKPLFGTSFEAEAWLHSEARARGFEKMSLAFVMR